MAHSPGINMMLANSIVAKNSDMVVIQVADALVKLSKMTPDQAPPPLSPGDHSIKISGAPYSIVVNTQHFDGATGNLSLIHI